MPPSLEHTQPSQTALAGAVLKALQQRDDETLRALALSEQEFRDHVWPELPAARPERNLPVSYVWQDLRQKSEAGLARTVDDRGGRQYELVDIRFGGTTQYRTFVVHRESIATVAGPDGAREDVRLFGSVLEKDGRVKVFSYVVD